MNNQHLGLDFAGNRSEFIRKLIDIIRAPQFCGEKLVDLRKIFRLASSLKDDITYIFEFPYVDRHYRDTFYFYHSAKFEELSRNCIRVHLFAGFRITVVDDIFSMSDEDKQKYRGFFIIRPILKFPLGRSLVAPAAFKDKDIVCCLIKNNVSLFGQELGVSGFPHIAQDTETHTCAESSLWSLFEYLGNRHTQYLPLLPSQIIDKLSFISSHRSLPSTGLNLDEISRCLHDSGCECVMDTGVIEHPDGTVGIDEFRLFLLKVYIESGIPVYIILSDYQKYGHAVLIIGHENKYNYIVIDREKVWCDVSDFSKRMVVIDDNMPPYQIAHLENLISYNQNYKIHRYIVPLPRHMNLDAQAAYTLSKNIFDDVNVGLGKFGKSWLTRLFLTGSQSFKEFLLKKSGLDEIIQKYLLLLSFPRFIWICEIYKADEFEQRNCSGLLIIDATGSKSLASILWYSVCDKIMPGNGFGWIDTITLTRPFKMATYKHNLKEA